MKIFLLTTSLLLNLFAFCQCDEYYINELISGNDDKCYFEGGTKVRFCPNLQGMAIGEFTLDISQWDGISTQYITVTKNGDIAGTVVLKLNEKELLLNLNGCGGSRTYSISLSKNKYEQWLNDKPSRDLAKQQQALRLQEQKMKFQQDSINIQRIKAENNLNSYFKILDSVTVNHILDYTYLSGICTIINVDTITIDYINRKTYVNFDKAHVNVDYHNSSDYCERMKQIYSFVKSSYSNDNKPLIANKHLSWDENDQLFSGMHSYFSRCELDASKGGGWTTKEYKLEDFFSQDPDQARHHHDLTEINIDTIIDGYKIPLNVRFQIVLSKKTSYSTDVIYKPVKYKDSQLFYSNEDFKNKSFNKMPLPSALRPPTWEEGYVLSGYYSLTYTEGSYPLPNIVLGPNLDDPKYLIIEKTKYNLLYANNILIQKQFDSKTNEVYKFKKVK